MIKVGIVNEVNNPTGFPLIISTDFGNCIEILKCASSLKMLFPYTTLVSFNGNVIFVNFVHLRNIFLSIC